MHTVLAQHRDTDLVAFCDQSTPFVSVDSAQNIENPFTGKSSGLIRLWTCIGTAEQVRLYPPTGVVAGFVLTVVPLVISV
jgi:hypothetical protein